MADRDSERIQGSSNADIKKEKAQRKLDVDAILNRAAVRLAETQRLVDAMLGSSPGVEAARAREREEAELASRSQIKSLIGTSNGQPRSDDPFEGLVGREETSGLGSVLPVATPRKPGMPRVSTNASAKGGIEDLRRKLLGKKAVSNGNVISRPRGNETAIKRQGVDSDSDEEESRAGAFTSSRTSYTQTIPRKRSDPSTELDKGFNGSANDAEDDGRAMEETFEDQQPPSPNVHTQSKKPKSFLDEVLLERENKKRKKRRKKNKQQTNPAGPVEL